MSNETANELAAKAAIRCAEEMVRFIGLREDYDLDDIAVTSLIEADNALREKASRLRGEAAPEGQQAVVACTVRKDTGLTVTADRLPHYMGARLPAGTKLYTSPQPVAPAPVAGEAVARLVEKWRDESLKPDTYGHASCAARRVVAMELEAALAQDRASQAGAAGVPEGWRLVPEKPTEAMLDRGWEYGERIDNCYDREGAYADLIAAAPTPAAERKVQ